MLPELLFTLILVYVLESEGLMEPKIIKGKFEDIENFPHSVFIDIACVDNGTQLKRAAYCGGSILNQKLVLTAAHCLIVCTKTSIGLIIGHADISKGTRYNAVSYLVHKNFDEMGFTNDIGLIKAIEQIVLGKTVQRVVILPDPPPSDKTFVAGWGVVDTYGRIHTKKLKSARAKVLKIGDCALLPEPNTQFCTNVADSKVPGEFGFAAGGDSGSGLIQDGYIIIGLVSYKDYPIQVVAFTNVSTYVPWIEQNARDMYCSSNVSTSF